MTEILTRIRAIYPLKAGPRHAAEHGEACQLRDKAANPDINGHMSAERWTSGCASLTSNYGAAQSGPGVGRCRGRRICGRGPVRDDLEIGRVEFFTFRNAGLKSVVSIVHTASIRTNAQIHSRFADDLEEPRATKSAS